MHKIEKIRKLLNFYNLDGYIIPKNDEFFGEYINEDKDILKYISYFSGSYGFALIFKKRNYLFVDGRYTLQAKIQSGKTFRILTDPGGPRGQGPKRPRGPRGQGGPRGPRGAKGPKPGKIHCSRSANTRVGWSR